MSAQGVKNSRQHTTTTPQQARHICQSFIMELCHYLKAREAQILSMWFSDQYNLKQRTWCNIFNTLCFTD